ncbi:MAG TPA: hypothetical protein VIY28_09680 [Pseudonocardiaceae bacterium]
MPLRRQTVAGLRIAPFEIPKIIAAAQERGGDVDAALEQAADLAEHTGEGNAHYLSFGPTNVNLWRLSAALESGNLEHAADLAESLIPERIIAPTRRAVPAGQLIRRTLNPLHPW